MRILGDSNTPVLGARARCQCANVLWPDLEILSPHAILDKVNRVFLGSRMSMYTQNRHPIAATPVKSACKTVIATSLRR